MKKRLVSLTLAGLMLLSVAACSSSPSASGNTSAGNASSTPGTSASSSSASTSTPTDSKPQGLTAPIAETPVLLTSVGQSADVEMVKVLLTKAGIDPTVDNKTDGSNLGDAKTLVLAVGGSTKGLGAAGIDANTEIARVEKLIDAADKAGLTIIAVHLGGAARRGELSDRFIDPSFAKADYAIVVEAGDTDGKMAGLAKDAGIPLDYADSMATVLEPLKAAFK